MSDYHLDPPPDSPDPGDVPESREFESFDDPVDPVYDPPDAPPISPEITSPLLPPVPPIVFEDLTLGQALGFLFWRPVQTARLFWQVLTREPGSAPPAAEIPLDDERSGPGDDDDGDRYDDDVPPDEWSNHGMDESGDRGVWQYAPTGEPDQLYVPPGGPVRLGSLWDAFQAIDPLIWAWIAVLGLAALLAIRGGRILYDASTDIPMHIAGDTNGAGLWLALAGAVYLGFELIRSRNWWTVRFPRQVAGLRARFVRNDLPLLWGGALALAVLVLIGLATLGGFGPVIGALLLILAAVVWLIVAVGIFSLASSPPTSGRLSLPTSGEGESSRASSPLSASAAQGGGDLGEGLTGDVPDVFVVQSAVRDETDSSPSPRVERGTEGVRFFPAHAARLLLVPLAVILSVLAYNLNVSRDVYDRINDVQLTTGGTLAWVGSIVLWAVILGVDLGRVSWRSLPGRARALLLTEIEWDWLRNWTVWVLAAIMLVGAYFRLHDLSSTPPEMTSDHIEKLLDALKVHEGNRSIFFPNNGGREGFQMYVVAFLAGPLGVGFSFTALKLATVIEGLITIPLLWWMARQVFGTATERDRQIGNWVGLVMAGLVAISSWHVMLSRLGLRIALTPLTTVIVIGLLARVMRRDRTRDYLLLGAVLGAGTYFYQANRMLPILVVAGIGLAMLDRVRGRRDVLPLVGEGLGLAVIALVPLLAYRYAAAVLEQSGYTNTHDAGERLVAFMPLAAMVWWSAVALWTRSRNGFILRYGGGLLVTAVIALALYIPMYHYSELHANEFWNRTWGRLYGEKAFWRLDPATGAESPYDPAPRELAERFWEQRDVFVDNYRDALRMVHWEGDTMWITNRDSHPALQGVEGGLAILGGLMWIVVLIRRRDPVLWLIPASVIVMLLPSAMTLAYTIENPSFTRASGTIPAIFLLAALPVGMLCWYLARIPWQWRKIPLGVGIALVLVAGLLWSAIGPNWDNYFTDYRLGYSHSWKPYSKIAEPLDAFAHSAEGSYGNAFMVAYPHWLDHRILGTMAGDIRWPNGLVTRESLFQKITENVGTPYEYNPNKKLFIMYHPGDEETGIWLQMRFPGGTTELYTYHYEALEPGTFLTGQFYIYTVFVGFLN